MPTAQICSECGQPLPGGDSEVLCPVCALRSVADDPFELEPLVGEDQRSAGDREQTSSSCPSAPLPRSLGDYELLEEIARGGMGVVFRARQKSLDRIVALKLVIGGPVASAAALERFQAEAQTAGSLQHPNIVAIHEVGAHEGQAYFSMDFIEGRDLAQVLRDGPLPPRQAAGYVKAIAKAIEYAHQRGILHRDLKPSNVLIDPFDRPRITDFGLAKRLSGDSELTVSGQVLGSPNFMAPEQARGVHAKTGPWSDVYSIGAVLYHLITGRPPFQAATLTEVLRQVVANAPAAPRLLNPSLPIDLETICLKCLEKEPGRRYPTAQALADELGRFLGGQPILARPIDPVGKTWRWCRRNPRLTAALGAAALSLVLGFAGISLALRGERIQRQRAEAGELSARQNAYVLAMHGAQQALNANNQARALELLKLYGPVRESETDLRGFEWRYLWQECQNEAEGIVGWMGSRIRCLEVSPDGRWLVAGSELAGITLWNLVTGEQIHLVSEAGVKGGIKGFAAFSPDSLILACTDQTLSSGMGRIGIWDTRTRRFQPPITNALFVGPMSFSTDGRLFGYGMVGPRFERVGAILDFATHQQIARIVLRTGITSDMHGLDMIFTADGKSMVFSENLPDLRLGLWTFLGDPSTNYFPAHKEAITAMAISPDGKSLASAAGYSETTIKLWQVPSFQPLGDLPGHQAWVAGLKFSPDGKILASAGNDKTIRLWDVRQRTLRRVFQRLPQPVYRVCFSPDGRKLFSGDGAGDIYRWSVDAPAAPAACRTMAEKLDVVTLAPQWLTIRRDSRRHGLSGDNRGRRAAAGACGFWHQQSQRSVLL